MSEFTCGCLETAEAYALCEWHEAKAQAAVERAEANRIAAGRVTLRERARKAWSRSAAGDHPGTLAALYSQSSSDRGPFMNGYYARAREDGITEPVEVCTCGHMRFLHTDDAACHANTICTCAKYELRALVAAPVEDAK